MIENNDKLNHLRAASMPRKRKLFLGVYSVVDVIGFVGLGMILAFAGCTSPTEKYTLLPSKDQRATAIVVQSTHNENAPENIIASPYEQLEINHKGQTATSQTDAPAIASKFATLFKLEPPQPQWMTLYFESGGADLTEDSKTKLPDLVKILERNEGAEIRIIGYTDTTGTFEKNEVLSLQRAQAIRNLLIVKGAAADRIDAFGRGERDLIVPTPRGVAELRNRRVELWIR